jgi:hypothetical protein
LVDFGAVQDVYHNTLTGGNTVVGTYGYMAPEQFRGQAVLATDLYALGATLIFLLTLKAPTDLPHRQLKIDFRPHVRVTKQFADWLERMIEPVAEDRFLSAEEALAVLRGKNEFTRSAESLIVLMNDGKQLVVEIPSVLLRSPHSRLFALLPLSWNGFLLLSRITWQEVTVDALIMTLTGLFLFSAFGLMGLWMLATFIFSAVSRTRLEIDECNFRLQRLILGWCYQKVQGRTQEISQVELQGIGLSMNKAPITVCTLRWRSRKHRFGSFLSEPEKAWLVAEVKDFLEKQQNVETQKIPASQA